MKKLFIPVVVLLVAAFIITGCGGTSPTTSNPAPTTSAVIPTTTSAQPATSTTGAPPTSAAKPVTTTTSVVATKPPTTAASNKFGGTLRVIENQPPGPPIGAEWEGNLGTYNTQQWALERLLKEKLDGSMQPEMVESWEVTATGDTPNVLFHLRKGVKFGDGSDWNAKALAWNLQIYKDGKMFGSTTNNWKSWDIIDDNTLRLYFSPYLNTLMRSWENYFFVSPTAYDKNGIEWMRTHMVGTAAFSQTQFIRDVSTTLVRNPVYWQQGKPYIDGVQVLYVVDQLTREALMKSGGGDMLTAVPLQTTRFAPPDFTVNSRNGGAYLLLPDSKNPDSPWSNPKVRMAADYAIDKDGLNKALNYGYGGPAYQMSSPATLAFDPALESKYRKYDVAKAKQLLTEAGYPNGFKTTLFLMAGGSLDLAVGVQANLAKIGITVDVQTPDAASYQAISTGPLKLNSMCMHILLEYSNFNTTMNVFFARTGMGFYFPSLQKPGGAAAWDAMATKSLTSPAPDPVLLKQIGDAFFDDCTVIPIIYMPSIYITNNRVHDTGLNSYGTSNAWDYGNVWLSK